MKHDHWGRMLAQKASDYKGMNVYKWKGALNDKWESLRWESFYNKVNEAALALIKLGIMPGDNVAIWAENMPQWLVSDLAIFSVRAVSVPLYANSTPAQAQYILTETQAKVLFVGEQEQYDKTKAILENLPQLTQVVVMAEPKTPEKPFISFNEFLSIGKKSSMQSTLEERKKEADINELATIIYTSGTTGVPKGVMLTHANFAEMLRTHEIRLKLYTGDSSIAFLPMSHIFERGWIYMCLNRGVTVYFNHNPAEIQATLPQVRPNYMCTVPRFWEKVYAAVNMKVTEGSPIKKKIFDWTQTVGEAYYLQHLRYKKTPNAILRFKHAIANKLVYSKIKRTAGIENAKLFPCAGAALAPEIASYFHRMGIPIMIGYGLTETTASVNVNDYYNYNLASIGKSMPDLEVKIGENNEIMVKGKTVMAGYYKKPEETAAVFEGEWFKTGDAGYFTEEGDLVMTERIKELYKTATGKYVAPNYIEAKLALDNYIEQIVVFGDRKKYITALISPSLSALKKLAEKMGISYITIDELLTNKKILTFFEDKLVSLQVDFARFEQIKKFRLLQQPFSVETGELTSTLKLRRKIIFENYKDLIESMYKD